MENALIIFARRPRLGAVKTRLAASLGDDAALRFYIRLLEHTYAVARAVPCDRFLFLTGEGEPLQWEGFTNLDQAEGDLGSRMQHAFEILFGRGYVRVVIIGSDCPTLGAADISDAFAALESHHAVLGPANDGGYYLLGLKEARNEIFQAKEWSTDTVARETVSDFERLQWKYRLLPKRSDVDTVADLPEGWI